MQCEDETIFEQRERANRESHLAALREEKRQKALRDAYIAVAATESGRLVLSDMVADNMIAGPFDAFRGNAQDAHNMGKAWFAMHTKSYLREILDRETFISIIEPVREEEHVSD